MTDYAVVVGCDAYPALPDGDLTTAVTDALSVRKWLLDNGNATSDTVRLLASPTCDEAAGPATRRQFARLINSLVERQDVGEQDRLFVYFAGHGCGTDPNNAALSQDAIAFTDYDVDDPAADCIGIQDMMLRLDQSGFGSVVVFVDACRDYVFTTAFQLSGLGVDPPPRNRDRRPRAYLGQATHPGGVTAGELGVGGEFTTALLAGLCGDGSAKVFDETTDQYVVHWSSLRAYLETKFPDRRLGLRGDGELVFAEFPDTAFPLVTLSIDVEPAAMGNQPDLRVMVPYTNSRWFVGQVTEHPGPTPVRLSVSQRRHTVYATTGDFSGRKSFDVYDDHRVTVPLSPDEPVVRMLVTDQAFRRAPAARFAVRTDDPCAVVEIRDVRGNVKFSGVGNVRGSLPPGPYYAVLISPDNHDVVAPLDVWPYETAAVFLPAARSRFAWPVADAVADAATDFAFASGGLHAANDVMTSARHLPPEQSVVGIRGTMSRPTGFGIVGMARDSAVGLPRVNTLDHATPGWSLQMTDVPEHARVWISVDGHVLSVPTLPGAATGVFLGAEELVVGLYDRALDGRPKALSMLDRAQLLLRGGRDRAAETVLTWLQRRPELDVGLGGTDDRSGVWQLLWNVAVGLATPGRHGAVTAAAGAPEHRRHVLGGGPWHVRDEPAARHD